MRADETTLDSLGGRFHHCGRVVWLGLRPGRREAMSAVQVAEALGDRGLAGDRAAERIGGRRQVTLVQAEHLEVMAALLGAPSVHPQQLRRNLVVSGINLLTLKDRHFTIGDAVLHGTGPCHPCSRMEENLGFGGYAAMRGHGGITARIVTGGLLRVGDAVSPLPRILEY